MVQRRSVGEPLDVVDGRGVRLCAEVAAVSADGVRLTVRECVREAPAPVELVLVQALAKGDRGEAAIEAATELGVDEVVPWQAERSVVQWRGPRADTGHARWEATVRAAAKQSRRAFVPTVHPALDSAGVARLVSEVVAGDGSAIVLYEAAVAPLLAAALPEDGGRILVVVGPEGGISDRELELFGAAGATLARLGPHLLRMSTAGPVAVAMLAERLGRWASSSRFR